jgi:hypothetical protein
LSPVNNAPFGPERNNPCFEIADWALGLRRPSDRVRAPLMMNVSGVSF